MTVRDRVMQCECGTVLDRDRNAAVNIMLRYLSQNALWTGYRRFASNLRQTDPGDPGDPRTLAGSPLRKRGVVHYLFDHSGRVFFHDHKETQPEIQDQLARGEGGNPERADLRTKASV